MHVKQAVLPLSSILFAKGFVDYAKSVRTSIPDAALKLFFAQSLVGLGKDACGSGRGGRRAYKAGFLSPGGTTIAGLDELL